jgi:hypothetical protein
MNDETPVLGFLVGFAAVACAAAYFAIRMHGL